MFVNFFGCLTEVGFLLGLMAKDPIMLTSFLNANVRPNDKPVKTEEPQDRGCFSAANISKAMQTSQLSV